jgi:hypothetical protein
MVRSINKLPFCLSTEEVVVRACLKVLVEVDDNTLLIVGNAQWILGCQLEHQPIHLLNIIILLTTNLEIILYY